MLNSSGNRNYQQSMLNGIHLIPRRMSFITVQYRNKSDFVMYLIHICKCNFIIGLNKPKLLHYVIEKNLRSKCISVSDNLGIVLYGEETFCNV